jgi:sugar (pentulose or hexulose) kinase
MSLAFALDLGTTSLSAVAVSRDGRVVARLNRPNPAHRTGLAAGRAEQDPHALRSAAFAILKELVAAAPGNPMCLGLTGQMHGGLMVDRQRRPLTPLITWQDRRATEPSPGDPSRSILEEFRARCRPADVLQTGCTPSPGYLAVTLFALQAAGAIPDGMHRATLIADWIAAELTDVEPVTDRTNAASTGVYDLAADGWSHSMLEAVGLNRDWLPEVRRSGSTIGVVSPEVAAETGLPAGLPVANAIGDNQAAVLGSVPVGETAYQINVGTGGQINWSIPSFRRVEGMDTRPLPQDRFMLVGAGLAGGDAYAWVRRTVQSWLAAFGQSAEGDDVYESLNRLAAAASEDCDGLRCEPVFRGTRRQPTLRGSFHGVTNENFTPGNVARAVLKGIAAGMKWFADNAGDARPTSIARIIGSGNGLRKNPLLVRSLSETFGLPVVLPEHEEEAAVGAALLAGAEVGLWPDLATAGRMIRPA